MDGVEDDPEGRAMRQVPPDALLWGHTAWISETGDLRKRYYDVTTNTWIWGDVRTPVVDRSGRVGHRINGRFRTLEQAVALAWVPRRTAMPRLRRVVYRGGAPSNAVLAHNLEWSDERSGVEDDLDDDDIELTDDDQPVDEEWRKIAFKTAIVPCVSDWEISREGRVRVRDRICTGTYALGPSRFFPVVNIGLVPLDDLKSLLFRGERREEPTPPRIKRVMRLIRRDEGASIASIAAELAVRESTAWSYAYMALQRMSTASAQRHTVRLLRDPILQDVVLKVAQEAPIVYRCRLRELTPMITRVLASNSKWLCNPHRYSELCAVRTLLQRTYASNDERP